MVSTLGGQKPSMSSRSNLYSLSSIFSDHIIGGGAHTFISLQVTIQSKSWVNCIIHNDTSEAFGRLEDMFQDNGMLLKPVFAIYSSSSSFNTKMLCLNKKVILITLELGTADFIIHHIHAFTIHVALLICMKAILYARESRSLSSKLELGWLYPMIIYT